MNRSLIVSLLLISVVLFLTTCKQTDVLPEATQTGRNTFGCLIDGKTYVPDGGTGFMPPKPINGGFIVTYGAKKLAIYIWVYAKDNRRIQIYVSDYIVGHYLLNNNTQTKPVSLNPQNYGLYISPEGKEYVTSLRYTGQITITKADTVSNVVSGNFDFTAATPTGETVSITNGRFDVTTQ